MISPIFFIVHTFDKSNTGGVLKAVADQANALSLKGWNVTIVSLGQIYKNAFDLNALVNVCSLDLKYYDTRQLRGVNKVTWFFRVFGAVRDFIDSQAVGSIFISSSPPLSILFGLLPRKYKLVGHDHTSTTYKVPLLQPIRNLLLRRLNYMIGLTEEDVQYYVSRGISAVCIPNFIRPFEQQKDNTRKYVVFIGRFTQEKNPLAALQIFHHSEIYKSGYKLVMYGYGPLKDSLKDYIVENNLVEEVAIVEGESSAEKMLTNAAVLIATSIIEGFPIVLLEAICMGVPCISYDAGYGPRNIIKNDVNGYLVNQGDYKTFSKKVREFTTFGKILDEDIIKKSINSFYIDQVIGKWENLFKTIS